MRGYKYGNVESRGCRKHSEFFEKAYRTVYGLYPRGLERWI